MPLYEHVYIARQDVSQQQVEALTESLQTIITENGGSIAKTEYWGLRTMAYKIKKNRKGHYTLMNIDAPHPAVAEMERQMALNEDILRHITLRVDEHDEKPSAILANKGRDDRGRGRGGPPRGRDDRGGRGDRGDRRPRDDRPREDRPRDDKPREERKPS